MWTNLYQAFIMNPPSPCNRSVLNCQLCIAHPHGHSEKMAIRLIIQVHPPTNKKMPYVNEYFTRRMVEMSAGESNRLLSFLTDWVASPRLTGRYPWTLGTHRRDRQLSHYITDKPTVLHQ